jgi:FkbM family methyltransferase
LFDPLRRPITSSPATRSWFWRLGRKVYCAARGDGQPNAISSNGEADVQACVVKAMPAATKLRAVDIGANLGEWTLSLLAAVDTAHRPNDAIKIELFEPVSSTIERLQRTLSEAAAASKTQVHKFALSNEAGKVSMAIMSDTGGTNSLHFDDAAGTPPGGGIEVETNTLTEFCANHAIEHVHLTKCDAEGHDFKVLSGAKEMLRDARIDVFQFEYNQLWIASHSFLKDVFDLIQGLPYSVARVCPGSIEVYAAWHPELDRALGWFATGFGSFYGTNTHATLQASN